MKSSAKKVELASVDDLFSTEESRADAQREKVVEIPLSELHPFKGHPFKVKDDEAMMETADSIKQYGVLVPAIARPDPEGGYELVAGHRRHRASELAEKETMPVIVRDLDDDAATIIMLKDAPIVILDEATANVDPENEDRLQKAIEELTKDKTIIMIAHRLKTVRNADQILVVDNGKIVQQGKHDDLIKQQGIYADFVLGRKEAIGWKLNAGN